VAHGDGALYGYRRYGFAAHGEVHIDMGEHFGVDLGAPGLESVTAFQGSTPLAFWFSALAAS
jgi:hypothetical protein